jgi:hypothetical protein
MAEQIETLDVQQVKCAWARRYATLPKAQRTLANGVRAWFDFMRTPLSPGYNTARYEREMGFKAPAQLLFAMEDGAWKRERIAQFQGSSPPTAGGEVVSDDHHGGGESAKRDNAAWLRNVLVPVRNARLLGTYRIFGVPSCRENRCGDRMRPPSFSLADHRAH